MGTWIQSSSSGISRNVHSNKIKKTQHLQKKSKISRILKELGIIHLVPLSLASVTGRNSSDYEREWKHDKFSEMEDNKDERPSSTTEK